MSPQRIQLRRTRGWRKPEGVIVVTRPSRWGNPWRVVPVRDSRFPWGDAADVVHVDGDQIAGRFERYSSGPMLGAPYWAVQMFRLHLWLPEQDELLAAVTDLAGHDLACWCPLDQPCHADVLLEIANGGPR